MLDDFNDLFHDSIPDADHHNSIDHSSHDLDFDSHNHDYNNTETNFDSAMHSVNPFDACSHGSTSDDIYGHSNDISFQGFRNNDGTWHCSTDDTNRDENGNIIYYGIK